MVDGTRGISCVYHSVREAEVVRSKGIEEEEGRGEEEAGERKREGEEENEEDGPRLNRLWPEPYRRD